MRDSRFWDAAVERLRRHETPEGLPRYGYLLAAGEAVVGVILTIFSRVPEGAGWALRCNVSSWYVEDAYRPFGTMLISRAFRHREATYLNVTPAPATWAILVAQGYRKYCEGRIMAFPALTLRRGAARVVRFVPGQESHSDAVPALPPAEAELVTAHAGYGCLVLLAISEGRAHPFVFAPRRKLRVIPIMFLIYCRDIDDFVRFSPSLGRYLAVRGTGMIVVDADGPMPGLPGLYRAGYPKFVRGPGQARLGDVAYTERAMFGV